MSLKANPSSRGRRTGFPGTFPVQPGTSDRFPRDIGRPGTGREGRGTGMLNKGTMDRVVAGQWECVVGGGVAGTVVGTLGVGHHNTPPPPPPPVDRGVGVVGTLGVGLKGRHNTPPPPPPPVDRGVGVVGTLGVGLKGRHNTPPPPPPRSTEVLELSGRWECEVGCGCGVTAKQPTPPPPRSTEVLKPSGRGGK